MSENPALLAVSTPLKIATAAADNSHIQAAVKKASDMFATANRSNALRGAGAYRQVHAVTGVEAATPHGLIGMLYDGLIGAIAEARGAMRAGNIAAKGQAIGRAVRIVDEGLSAPLNLEEGGALASDLRNLYTYVAMRLTQANLHNDETALDECVRLIEPLRSAWSQIADRVPA